MTSPITDISQLTPGTTFSIYLGERNINNADLEVRGIVDSKYVCRAWSDRRETWDYCLHDVTYLRMLIQNDHLFMETVG